MSDPITLHRYKRWSDAEQARDHLKANHVNAFIIFDGPLVDIGSKLPRDAFPSVQLVARPEHAGHALELLEIFRPEPDVETSDKPVANDMGFYGQSAWMVSVFSIFYIMSFLVKGAFTSIYLVPAGFILLVSAIFLFCTMYVQRRHANETVLG